MTNEDALIEFLARAHEASIKVYMDDFGSGYSSLNSLKDLNIDGIKLDYKFFSKTDNVRKMKCIIENVV